MANGTGYNMGAPPHGNPNVRDRYMANFPGGDPDFDREGYNNMGNPSNMQTPTAQVQPVLEEKKEEEPKKKSGGFFGLFKKN